MSTIRQLDPRCENYNLCGLHQPPGVLPSLTCNRIFHNRILLYLIRIKIIHHKETDDAENLENSNEQENGKSENLKDHSCFLPFSRYCMWCDFPRI